MNKPKVTPKDFFLWFGAMVAFYWSVVSFIFLFFSYVDYAFPNPLQYVGDPYSSGIPYEMASIIVVFPAFVFLMWLIRQDIAHDATRRDIWVRRWALILTLFVAGVTAVIDIVTLLTTFFRGEDLTAAFLIKVAVVLLVAAMVFMHFIADLWGYWQLQPVRNRYVLYGVSILAIASVCSGFLIVGTPQQARTYRLDEQRISDLQQIQSQIVGYWQAKEALPASLADLSNSISGYHVPMDPQTGEPYEYKATGATSFELCAAFAAPTSRYAQNYSSVPASIGTQDTWTHGTGRTCFERTIDTQLYPPNSKTAR